MKLIYSSCILLTMFCFVSCDDDADDTTGENNDSIEGTWNAISFSAETNSEYFLAGTLNVIESDMVGSEMNYTAVFNAGTITTSGGYTTTSATVYNGQNFPTEPQVLAGIEGNLTYVLDGNQITITGSMFSFSVAGQDLLASSEGQTLMWSIGANGRLTLSQNETITSGQAGTSYTTDIVSTSVWERE